MRAGLAGCTREKYPPNRDSARPSRDTAHSWWGRGSPPRAPPRPGMCRYGVLGMETTTTGELRWGKEPSESRFRPSTGDTALTLTLSPPDCAQNAPHGGAAPQLRPMRSQLTTTDPPARSGVVFGPFGPVFASIWWGTPPCWGGRGTEWGACHGAGNRGSGRAPPQSFRLGPAPEPAP